MAGQQPQDGFQLVGASFNTAPLDVLDRLALSADEVREFYDRITAYGEVSDAMVVSTCNRTEIYTLSDSDSDTTPLVSDTLARVTGGDRVPPTDHLYRGKGDAGVRHLFRVACGLDSLVLGETQILGQVKDAFTTSCGHHEPSAYFDRVMRSAFKVARRSRADTEIGRGAVSIASAGVHLATRIYSDLRKRCVVVVGSGDTGRLTAEHFKKHRPGRLVILNRTFEKAQRVADELGIEAGPLDDLEKLLAQADIVASAVSVREPLITRAMVDRAMHQRTGIPLALLDLGLPRNIESSCADLSNVFSHDIEDLKEVVDGNLERRRQEVARVEDLIDREVDNLIAWQKTAQVGPVIARLRDGVEAARRIEVAKATAALSPREQEAVERATRAVVNKLMHGPTTSIKEIVRQRERSTERLDLIHRIFSHLSLDDDDE